MKRLREVCAQYGLPDQAERRLEALLELVATDPAAPTSVTDPAQAVDTHVADSLSALPLIATRVARGPVVDIGAGAGFPGLAVAIARPDLELDLLEATARKCAFLERALARIGLSCARVVCARAEDWARADGAGRYELALARAVGPLAELVEYASPLLEENGVLIAWKGVRDAGEEAAGERAARTLGLELSEMVQADAFPGARDRHLYVFEKIRSTPLGVPRRAGMARKRPFGGESSTPN